MYLNHAIGGQVQPGMERLKLLIGESSSRVDESERLRRAGT